MDGYYFAFSGASTFSVYVAIFPILQKLYKRVYDAKEAPKVDNSNSPTSTEVTNKNAAWNDLTFFIFGSVVYVIAYLLVHLFESNAALFLCKDSFHFCPYSHLWIHN
jgi:hypothetical protein